MHNKEREPLPLLYGMAGVLNYGIVQLGVMVKMSSFSPGLKASTSEPTF